jgi:serine/threonine protein kinase
MLEVDQALKIMDYDFIKERLKKQDIAGVKNEFIGLKERFINEAKLYKRIRHPNIVAIHDVDVIEDEKYKVEIPYITMDYIKGASLDHILKEKAHIGWRKAFNISMDVLDALDAIHKNGVIHRDIKPSNIMIKEQTGEAILIDFGLAKNMLNETALTSSGIMMGTPAYMSPEQYNNPKNINATSDIYSFGVVLYEMLTGDFPFNRTNYGEIMYEHLYGTVPNIRLKNPDLPIGIENIIFKAMAKEPENRYKDAGQFRNAIRKIVETHKGTEIDKNGGGAKIGEEITRKYSNRELKFNRKNYIRKFKYNFRIGFIVLAIAAFFFLKSYLPVWQYDRYISSAKTFIESKDWEKARKALKNAKKIRSGNKDVIASLSKEIEEKQIEEQYQQLMDFADRYFNKGEYEKAKYYLSNAIQIKESEKNDELLKKIMRVDFNELMEFMNSGASQNEKLEKCREFLNTHRNVPESNEKTFMTSKITIYIAQIEAGKQIAIIKGDFETLEKFLASPATKIEKIEKCREFLAKHQNTPWNKITQAMLDEANRFIANLNADVKASEQYQKYVDTVNNLIKSEDYEEAKSELEKARKINDSDEVKRLSTIIAQGLENERINSKKEYRAIYSKGGGDIVNQFQKAKEEFNTGQYVSAKNRIERLIGSIIIMDRGQKNKDISGACYLLLGAINEKEGETFLAEKNYRKAKAYSIESINGVDLDSLPLYRRVIK